MRITDSISYPGLDDRGSATRRQRTGESEAQEGSAAQKGNTPSAEELSAEQQKQLSELQKTDRLVREHEQAHLSVAGELAGSGASYSFTTGPDGRLYAVAGEVQIDSSVVPDDPKATVEKMQRVQRAALAPLVPSGQDRAIAAAAAAKQAQAQMKVSEESAKGSTSSAPSEPASFKNLLNVYSEPSTGDSIRGLALDLMQ